jgi:TPP-dependent pyruvate/acetoin dehydrogenase alpha subunit
MRSKKLLTRQRIQELGRTIQKEIDEAVAFAESKPAPEGADTLRGVYCESECWWQENSRSPHGE